MCLILFWDLRQTCQNLNQRYCFLIAFFNYSDLHVESLLSDQQHVDYQEEVKER